MSKRVGGAVKGAMEGGREGGREGGEEGKCTDVQLRMNEPVSK